MGFSDVDEEDLLHHYRRVTQMGGNSQTFCFICAGVHTSDLRKAHVFHVRLMHHHNKIVHVKIMKMAKVEVCKICGNLFSGKQDLDEHIDAFHISKDDEPVSYGLGIGAKLENLTDLQPLGGCDDPAFDYPIKIQCGKCRKITKAHHLRLGELDELSTEDCVANLIWKCGNCRRRGTVVLISGYGAPLTIEKSQSGEMACLMLFGCKGNEPVKFDFSDGWKAKSVMRGHFIPVDFSSRYFTEYDGVSDVHMAVDELKYRFSEVTLEEAQMKA